MAEHDLFVRKEMSSVEHASRVLELVLTEEQRARLKLDDMELLPTEYVNDSLRKIITDLTYKVPLHDDDGALCFVVEHKSEGMLSSGDILPFQLCEQEIAVMKAMRQNDPNKQYPIVKLVGLYHGSGPYPGPRTVAERMKGPPELIPERWKREDIIYVDLYQFDDAYLARQGRAGLFLLTLKHVYDSNLMDFVNTIIPRLQELDGAEHRDFLISLFRYLMTALNKSHYPQLKEIALKSFTEETGGEFMTIAEYLTQDVRAELTKKLKKEKENTQREREKAQREKENIALMFHQKGVDLQTISESTGIPIDRLELLIRPKAS